MNCANRHRTALATLGGLVAAALTTLVVFASITALFASSGRTPWVPADRARAVAHCADRRDAGSRHACLRATHAASTAADDVAHRREHVAEDVGADDRLVATTP